MTRVGFVVRAEGGQWLGGSNYLRNLLRVLRKLPGRRIEPVLLSGTRDRFGSLAGHGSWELLRTPLLDRFSPSWFLRAAFRRTVRRDPLLDRWLQRRGIRVLSHAGHLGRAAATRTVGWVPDFQHVRLPGFFPEAQRRMRDETFRRTCRHSSIIVVSSRDALRDLSAFSPADARKARVLPFVVDRPDLAPEESAKIVREKYGIQGPYFHLPNQFWAHKNHRLVLEALSLLREREPEILVVATGSTEDSRNRGYFAELMSFSSASGVSGQFRVLGVLPYLDMLAVMDRSLAVINPSLFEGWSTTVEEAKSLGKEVLLSDIPVHREQAPGRGSFFDPHSPASLAEHLVRVWSRRREAASGGTSEDFAALLEERKNSFGRAFERIALEALS